MNIINAICNLIENPQTELKEYAKSRNRANNMGESLEEYIKDLFAGVPQNADEDERNELIQKAFSYTGNQNNPPDAMLAEGDAIEVKKIESKNSSIALNSSYPKHKLFAESPMINKACREAEPWTEKDIIYAVGILDKEIQCLSSLAFVYGEDYCAGKEIYERIRRTIKNGVEKIEGIEFCETRELGHVNRVDPLGITYLRVRGMWGIENPFTVFNRHFIRSEKNKFEFMCIINEKKFNSFKNSDDLQKLAQKHENFKISDIKIKNPDNPAKMKNAKLISFFVPEENQ